MLYYYIAYNIILYQTIISICASDNYFPQSACCLSVDNSSPVCPMRGQLPPPGIIAPGQLAPEDNYNCPRG